MIAQIQRRRIGDFFLLLLLTMFAAGCGGGGGGTTSGSGSGGGDASAGTGTPAGVVVLTADAGAIIELSMGETASLDGSKSASSDGGAITYDWSFTTKPDNSKAVLQDPTSVNPSFVADARGTYTIQLVVSENGASSKRAIGFVTATDPNDSADRPIGFHLGLSPNCMNCHDDVNVHPGKSQDHMATSNLCQACHTTFGFDVINFVDHQEVFGKCSECHDGVIATGKSANHLVTTEECSNCHDTTSFLTLAADGSFDHSTITEPCSACHNGSTAIGTESAKSHPSIGSTECNACHSTVTFSQPFVDHTDFGLVGGKCSGCHDGAKAPGQPTTHPDTTGIECDVCHDVTSFNLGGLFDHTALARHPLACASCHDGVNATGQSSDHIPTSSGSDCSNCHDTNNFKNAFVDHTTSDVTAHADNCVFCHDGTLTGAPGKPVDHIPTTANCADCHMAGGSFSLATVDHNTSSVDGVCSESHNNSIATGKTADHLPTTEECDACHDKLSDTFAGGTFDHVGIDTTDCASCHDGVIATGKSTTHVPTASGVDCYVCHGSTDFTSFVITNFDHATAGITDNCESCHDGRRHDGTVVMGKSSNHIPAVDDCSTCHSSTISGGFASAARFDSTVHPAIVSGCGGCHNGSFPPAMSKADAPNNNHIPTTQDCNVCHINNISDAFKDTSNFTHAGITGNCESCHDGKHEDSNALGKVDAVPTHIATTADCHACHLTKGTDFKNAYVDHTSSTVTSVRCDSCHDGLHTGILGKQDAVPTHVVTTQDCGDCHTPGGSFATAVFDHSTLTAGTRCDSCHNNTASATATGPSSTHIAIPNDSSGNPEDCAVCHNTTSFAGAQFDHSTLSSSTRCDSCHGTTATGKPTNHVPTSQDCRVCHVTAGFLPATFNHSGPETSGKRCDDCHDGVIATGKTSTHIATTDDCGACHSTDTFADAIPDHSGITDGCGNSGCHDGSDPAVVSKNDYPNHIPTSADCHFCHTVGSFAGATMDHSVVNDSCSTCHDNTLATGKPSGHFVTSLACDACHNTTNWTPISYTHPSSSDYPGDHNSRVTCSSCHTNNRDTITYSSPTYAPYCAACHEGDYKPGDHRGTIADNKNCGKSGCHRVSSRSF
jgi:hypothetical protein